MSLPITPHDATLHAMKALFAGGGTLGPVTPLLAVISELERSAPDAEIVFVGTPNGPERLLIEKMDIPFRTLDAPKLRRYLALRNLMVPIRLITSFLSARRIIREENPDIVVGAGGFTSVPIGLAAKTMGKRLLIHQQDVVPSLSNRILARAADAITVTFEKSLGDFPEAKTVLTGNPVRPAFERGDRRKGLDLLGFRGDRPVVLATGGGTGSAFLNEIVLLGSDRWTAFADLAHITGLEKSSLKPPALAHPERYRQLEFVGEDIVHLFAAADLIIARAGLGTTTELAALRKPVILVPIPDSHQEANASYLVERGGARMFRELDLTPEQLVHFAEGLLDDPGKMKEMGEALHRIFAPGAREAIAGRIIELTKDL